jgi:hypothetical protein
MNKGLHRMKMPLPLFTAYYRFLPLFTAFEVFGTVFISRILKGLFQSDIYVSG